MALSLITEDPKSTPGAHAAVDYRLGLPEFPDLGVSAVSLYIPECSPELFRALYQFVYDTMADPVIPYSLSSNTLVVDDES